MRAKAAKLVDTAYHHSAFRFLVIGGTTFCLDLGILIALHGGLHINVVIAATVSYWTSLVYNFILNRIWSFGAGDGILRNHVMSYSVLVVINYLFSLLVIAALAPLGINYSIAKALAVIISMGWNYVIYKHVIFKPRAVA